MEPVILVEKISIDPPREAVYRRLGYRNRTTEISKQQQQETDLLIHEAFTLVSLKGMLLRLDLLLNDEEKVVLAGDMIFRSRKLAGFLRGCRETVLMGATAGNAVMEQIKEKTREDNLAAAVVYDATASEMADAALDWMMNYFNRLIRREGKTLLPRRFSAGYADFDLKNQKIIYEALQMNKIGVSITPEFILLPEKSVTAVGGIC